MPLSDQPPPDGADDHAVTPGAAAGTRPTFADQLDSQDELWHRNRRRLIRLLVAFSVVAPFFSTHRPGAAGMGFLIPATAAFIVMTDRILLRLEWRMTPGIAWAWLTVMTGTALAILAVGGPNWVNALVIAGAAIGRISPSAEVADDGVGPAWDTGRDNGRLSSGGRGPGDLGSGAPGSGLAGLAERARAAGAEISAGEGRGGKGFRLRVRAPAGQFSVS